MDFYVNLLKALIAQGRLDPAASTLVVAGDAFDRDALLAAGFTDVTVSNLDTRMTGGDLAPFRWARLDAESLALEEGHFDQVIEHMGLHHCASPHLALLEMYRVAHKAVLIVENRDSATIRLAAHLGFAGDYELEAVRDGDFAFGGHRNSAVPNFVYRWTEREIEKTIACADPAYAVPIRYFYGHRFPEDLVRAERGLRRALFEAARLPLFAWSRLFPRQANVFGVLIDKSARTLHGWMEPSGERMRPDRLRAAEAA